MNNDVRTALRQGLEDLKKALPLLADCPEFGHGPVKFCTEESGSIAADLDMFGGFDGYQRYHHGLRGIAGRAQRCTRPHRTFSIRTARATGAQTEYEKRLWAIKHKDQGTMYPHWTVQSYSSLDGSRVLSIGLARTEELYLWIYKREKSGFLFDRRTVGNATFIAPSWDLYRQSGLFFYEYSAIALTAKWRIAERTPPS